MLKSVMAHQFALAPQIDCPRSKFDRSCGYKTTFDSGYLVPFFYDEVLPGDTFDVNATIFARMSTPIVPIMDNVFLDTFFFFVPLRLLWSNFQKFMGEQENPGDSTEFLCPIVNAPSGGFSVGSLFDYLGMPVGVSNIWMNAFLPRAYNRIYNEWFRAEFLQNSVPMNLGDGPDNSTDYVLLRRGKRHDYYTSCNPWPVWDNFNVDLPLGTSAPVTARIIPDPNTVPNFTTADNPSAYGPIYGRNIGGASMPANAIADGVSSYFDTYGARTDGNQVHIMRFNNPGLVITDGVADLSNATAATINSLRQAFQLQKFYERRARSGSRYIETILSFFGVKSPDQRLQRSEYLGGASNRIIVHQVEQNNQTTTRPLGSLGAYGVCMSPRNGFTKSFVEHGVIIGLVNVRADLTYQQGIDRMYSRRTFTDFYWPTFAHLGEQAVLNKEIYAQGSSVVDSDGNVIDDQVFGYQERYAEYRYKPSKITGKLRSGITGSLDVWHLSQQFTNLPTLSGQFIEENPPLGRCQAVQTEPQFVFDSYIQNICIRPMPVYSVPGLVDHF